MNANNDISWQARNDARTERKLRELASDLADSVESGAMTTEDANALYQRTADRWMHDA